MESAAPFALLLSDDLIFISRVVGTARSQGITVRSARSAQAMEALVKQQVPRCVIVDLANPGLSIGPFMERLKEICVPMPRVAAYGSHVDTATLQAGRTAGCDPVWPRSKFVQDLEKALPEWLRAREG
jgi:CheY-like chemotaxis protein